MDFICRPDPTGYPYYHFICNAIGTTYDATMDPTRRTPADAGYNPSYTLKTSRRDDRLPDRWQMECKIPFAQLGGRAAPKDGERWRVNFCRDGESLNYYSSWAYAAGNFHTVENFGELIFTTSDRAIRVGPLGDLAMGKVEAQVALTGFLFDPLVIVTGTVLGPDGKTVGTPQENRLADYRAVTIKAPPLVTGSYNLVIKAATAAGPMLFQRLPFRVIKAYDIAVEGYPYEGKLWITANVAGLTNPPAGLQARSKLMQGDKVVAEVQHRSVHRRAGRREHSHRHPRAGQVSRQVRRRRAGWQGAGQRRGRLRAVREARLVAQHHRAGPQRARAVDAGEDGATGGQRPGARVPGERRPAEADHQPEPGDVVRAGHLQHDRGRTDRRSGGGLGHTRPQLPRLGAAHVRPRCGPGQGPDDLHHGVRRPAALSTSP